jgi:murein DD-endopeptidase MepM/ murein hydrolase activator NlpD
MNIIFVSKNMAKARTLNLWQAAWLLFALITVPLVLLSLFILPQDGATLRVANPAQLLPANFRPHFIEDTQEHINALALQLGQIQARMIRLDALSERLAKMAGVKEKDLAADAKPGQGGPLKQAYNLDAKSLEKEIAALQIELEEKSDRLSLLEAMLLQQTVSKEMLPSKMPVGVAYSSSSYGWRVDPFTGQMAFHEGLDFLASTGTPIRAAASGIVIAAERTPDYGNLVKIDHGSGVETRYAHASKMLVKAGDRVEKGQVIAEVGSTGRSTGSHLHFEVRLNGASLDPRKYLKSQG